MSEDSASSEPVEAKFNFFRNETQNAFFASRDNRDALLQWNLDTSLKLEKFRFTGSFNAHSVDEYQQVLSDFFRSASAAAALNIHGTTSVPTAISLQPLGTSVMSLEFFDRLLDSVAPHGNIRGCYEDIFDGISVQDQLRELLVNENSENAVLFTETEKNEFIYRIFKLLAVGGSMCQPDDKIARYLETTKQLYKETVTIFRDSKTSTVQVSGRVFEIRSVAGLSLFANESSPYNALYIVVDPLKKEIQVLKNEFRSFW